MLQTLPEPEPSRIKGRWLTLAQLEEVGLSLHPFNLDDSTTTRISKPWYKRHDSQRVSDITSSSR